jgi:hypothetical protein
MTRFLLPIFIMFFFLSCGEESEQLRTGELVSPICTGFGYKSSSNQFLGNVGVVNNNLTGINRSIALSVFPIPASDVLNVSYNSNELKQIWLVRANVSQDVSNQNNFLNAQVISVGGEPIISIKGFTEEELLIDVSRLAKGYYRLYLKTQKDLLWENLIVN